MASCVAELAVSGEVVVVSVVVESSTATDWLAVTRAEDVEAEVVTDVGLTTVFPSEGRLTSVWTSLELTEVSWEVRGT